MTTLNLKNFDGLKMPGEFHLTKDKIEHFDVKNDDVWVTSYPKCGSTWCQEMVWLIGNDLNYEAAKTRLAIRFPLLELNTFSPEKDRFNKKHNLTTKFDSAKMPNFFKLAENAQSPRYIKSHLPFDFLPRQIIEASKTPKIVHIMRNPRQVAHSYYHHSVNVFPNYLGTLDDFIDLYVKGKLLYGDYFRTVLSYWKERRRPNLLMLTYEEMHEDLPSAIRKVYHFLGKSYSEDEIKKLAHHLSFNEMKKNPAVNAQGVIQNEEVHFIRKGEADSYNEELTSEIISKLDHWVHENVKGTGLPYECC